MLAIPRHSLVSGFHTSGSITLPLSLNFAPVVLPPTTSTSPVGMGTS